MLSPTWYPDAKQLRQFSVAALFGFGLMGLIARYQFGSPTVATVFFALAVVTFVVGLAVPRAVLPVYGILMLIAVPIGWVVSHVLLRILYFIVLTPFGLVFRLAGRDALLLKQPAGDSYWLERKQRSDVSDYYRQA